MRIIFPPKRTAINRTSKKILLAGKTYAIILQAGKRNSSHIDSASQTITFTLKDMTRENFEQYAKSWYRREARKLFKKSIAAWLEVISNLGYTVDTPRLKLYKMNRAWGRCYYTKGLITLNLQLGATPQECIDYITLHELCHFLEHSHSKKFYDYMTLFDNDWRTKEKVLNIFAQENFTKRPLFPIHTT
ncbi:MAG: YgjP-like metallopeptidase domain-containing protein [Rikenellaceae bacterium]